VQEERALCDVCFSNRPFGSQALSGYPPLRCRCRSRARASLRNRHQGRSIMGFENEAEQSFGRLRHSMNGGPSGHAISPHPSSREGHHATVRWSSRFLLSDLILHCYAAAASCLVQRNSVPSTQIRCMMTASRRASATIAFFMPRRLATCIAQALSQDHFVERISRIWAAS
jgi:hypothetical protein